MLRAVRICLANYVTFSGRARRPEFWWFMLACTLANLLASFLDTLIFGAPAFESAMIANEGKTVAEADLPSGITPFAASISLGTLLPTLAVSWRRLQDTGRPGWFTLLAGLLLILSASVLAFFITPHQDIAMYGSAWLAVPAMVAMATPVLILVLLIVWHAKRTQPGANTYGPEPMAW